jgi:hypothetical protein
MKKLTIIATALVLAVPTSAQALSLEQTRTGTVAESVEPGAFQNHWSNPVRMFATTNTEPAESHPPNAEWSQWLYGSHLGFTIPSNATVNSVSVEHGVEVLGGPELMNAEIELAKGATVLAGPTLEPGFGSGQWPNDNMEVEKYTPVLTPAEVDSTAFGVKIRDMPLQGGALIGVNRVKVSITYTVPSLHLYSNHVPLPESPSMPGLGWGTLSLESTGGTWTCQTIQGLSVAANAITVQDFSAYGCEAPTCALYEAKPYLSLAGEPLIKLGLSGTQPVALVPLSLGFGCGTKVTNTASGELLAEWESGSSIGASPARIRFGPSSGTLSGDALAGNLKAMGYEGGEMLSAK